MKVLWFTNTPSLAENYFNNKSMNGGFLPSLEKSIQSKVDLNIAFYYPKKSASFKYGDTTYHPIEQKKNTFSYKIKTKIFNKIEPEEDVQKFIKIIENVRPDIIHIHGTEGNFGLLQKNLKIPAVVSIQGNITVYELKFFSGISFYKLLRYSPLKKLISFNTNINYFFRFKKQSAREKEIFRLSKEIIGRTDWDRRITSVLAPQASYHHSDEVLKDIFYETEWQQTRNEILQLHTTTGSNVYKGIETLMHCAHLLDNINIPFQWTVAGIKPNDDIIQIAAKSMKIPISKNLKFIGTASDVQLKDCIVNCDIYIAISHIENSPNSLCEALITGVPCIATDAGGTAKFIDDRINGLLIQDGDPYSMAGCILELKNNYTTAVAYGAKARIEALKRHDRNTIITDLLKIYKTVIDKNSKPKI